MDHCCVRTSARVVVLVFLCVGSVKDVFCQDAIIPHSLDAAAKTWAGELSFFSEYELTRQVSGPKDGESHEFTCRGIIAFLPDAFRLRADWAALSDTDVLPYQSFDFVSYGGVDFHFAPRARVRNGLPPAMQASMGQSEPSYIYAEAGRLNYHTVRPFDSRFPIMRIPNPIGFCAGWNEGVVFGGLQISSNAANKIRDLFDQYGFSDLDEFQMQTSRNDDRGVIITQSFRKDNGGKVFRELVYEYFNGLPLKVKEVFRSTDEHGETTSTKSISVDEFISIDAVPVPTRLTMVQYIAGLKEGNNRQLTFRFITSSSRSAKKSDFSVPIGNSTRISRDLVQRDGFVHLLETDVKGLKQRTPIVSIEYPVTDKGTTPKVNRYVVPIMFSILICLFFVPFFMQKRNGLTLLLSAILLFGVLVGVWGMIKRPPLNQGTLNEVGAAGEILVEPLAYPSSEYSIELGNVLMSPSQLTKQLKIRVPINNIGRNDAKWTLQASSCSCLSSSDRIAIAPGDSEELIVTLKPNKPFGEITQMLHFRDEFSPDDIVIKVRATIVPELLLVPNPSGVGKYDKGASDVSQGLQLKVDLNKEQLSLERDQLSLYVTSAESARDVELSQIEIRCEDANFEFVKGRPEAGDFYGKGFLTTKIPINVRTSLTKDVGELTRSYNGDGITTNLRATYGQHQYVVPLFVKIPGPVFVEPTDAFLTNNGSVYSSTQLTLSSEIDCYIKEVIYDSSQLSVRELTEGVSRRKRVFEVHSKNQHQDTEQVHSLRRVTFVIEHPFQDKAEVKLFTRG